MLIGTLYPIVAAAFGVQLSVGKPFFDKAIGPIALALVAFMAAGPLLRWRRDSASALLKRMTWPVAGFGAALVVLVPFAWGIGALPLLGLALAAGLAVASVAPLWGRNLRRTPLFTWGMVIAHLGIAVSLAGMASDSAFTKETLVVARIGEPHVVGPVLGAAEGIAAGDWAELVGNRGRPEHHARAGGHAVHLVAASAYFLRSANRDGRIRDRNAARRAALYRARPAPTRAAGTNCACGGSRS